MSDSKRLATLKALSTFLAAEVTQGNGYKHDLDADGAVCRGKMYSTNEDPLPMITIMENIDPDRYPRVAGGELYSPITKEDWVLLVQGWAIDDKKNPTDPAYELMADVRKALAKLNKNPDSLQSDGVANPDFRLGGLIAGMTMEPGIARPPIEQVSAKAFFWMRIVLKFVENPNDPYQL